VAGGYRYELQLEGLTHEVGVNGAALTIAGRPLGHSQLTDLTPIEPWLHSAEHAASDAMYYRSARHPR
jgi:hypothetical protein